jgi:L-alanine-DL-glutamate epimerase-like enolase superfamily enzyme
MHKLTDVRVRAATLYFLPVQTRMPLKFGAQVVEQVTCARVCVTVENRAGQRAEGWGETPLSVAWVWPSELSWDERERRLQEFCLVLAREVAAFPLAGHPLEIGVAFQRERLPALQASAGLPQLAALCCLSPFDLAIYDAHANLARRPVFDLLGREHLASDLASLLDGDTAFTSLSPADFLSQRQEVLPVWHLVGGLDPLDESDLTGHEPRDGYPVLLRDWIRADGLRCLKIKLRGTDAAWDYERLVRVGQIAVAEGCAWLTADFNCTVTDPAYVCAILDRLAAEHSHLADMLLYVEQPFPYELAAHRIDVRSVAARKPLFLDESAHDWHHVKLGRELGWTGVALKTCKTLSGALLSLCWAKKHGLALMVQDLTNPMLAQIPHVQLAAHAGTLLGVESNGMQFYPEASAPERAVHPGLYRRREGVLDLRSLGPTGFGYRLAEIARELPMPAAIAQPAT